MQCSIDLNDNVLRVGGGEHAVPFLQGTVSCKAQKNVFEIQSHYEPIRSKVMLFEFDSLMKGSFWFSGIP